MKYVAIAGIGHSRTLDLPGALQRMVERMAPTENFTIALGLHLGETNLQRLHCAALYREQSPADFIWHAVSMAVKVAEKEMELFDKPAHRPN